MTAFCAARVCTMCELSCLLGCEGGGICLPADWGSSHFSICALKFTHCPSLLCSEGVGRETPGYFSSLSAISLLFLPLAVSPLAAASPRDSSSHLTGLCALRTPPPPLTYRMVAASDVANSGDTSPSPGCALNSLF